MPCGLFVGLCDMWDSIDSLAGDARQTLVEIEHNILLTLLPY